MRTKKLLAVCLSAVCAVTVAGALAACNDGEEEKPNTPEITEETLCTGIWDTPVINDPSGRHNFVAFHEDGIFYHSQYGGGMQDAGYWKLVKEEITFNLFTDYVTPGLSEGEKEWNATEATAYVELTNFDGTPYTTTKDADATDPNVATNKFAIYDDGTNGLAVYGIWYSNTRYIWDEDSDHTAEDETPVELCTYVVPGDVFQKVAINHNGATINLGSEAEDGAAWKYDAATRTYTITKEDGTTATLAVSEDGATAVYTGGDTTMTLNNEDAQPPEEEGPEAIVEVADSTGVFTLGFFNDGSYSVAASFGGQTQTMQEGKWSLSIPYFTVGSFETMMTGGDVTVTLSVTTTSGETSLSFTLTTAQLTTLSQTEISEPEPIVESTKDYFTLEFYADGSYKVVASMGGTEMEMKTGTWSLSIPTLTVDGTEYTMSADGVTVNLPLTTSQGAMDYAFMLTRDQLMALNG